MTVELEGNVRMRGDSGPGVRVHATVVLVAMILAFGLAFRDGRSASQLASHGFIAGGLVVGVAVLVGGSSSQPD